MKEDAVNGLALPRANPKMATFLLGLSMFMTGACGLVSEYILSTVSTYILGNSIEQFSITIACMMFMMGLAAYLQKFLSDDNLFEKFVITEALIAIIGGFAPIGMYAALGYMEDHFQLVQYFFVCSMGFLIGLEIPLVFRINQQYSKTLGVNIASIYGPDYIGAFIGALVWTYFLIKTFPLTEISFMLVSGNLLIAIWTYSYFWKRKLVRNNIALNVIIVLTSLAIAYGYAHNRDWSVSLEQRLYEDKIVYSETTKYQRLVMTHRSDIDEYRFYINGNLQFSSADEAIYHEQLVHPAMSLVPDHGRVLILGGGDGMALREVLKYNDVESVTLVDLDPDMVKISSTNKELAKLNNNAFADVRVLTKVSEAVVPVGSKALFQETGEEKKKRNKKNLEVQKIANVNILHLDADKFINEVRGQWNVIIVDFPDPNSVELSKLYSKEFYLKLKRVLAEKGMVVIQSTSPYHAKEAYLCVQRTVEAAGMDTLPYHDNVPSFGDWGWIMAWKNASLDPAGRLEKMEINVPTRYITPEVFRSATVFGKGVLESKFSDVNTLMYPTLLDKYVNESWKID